MPAFNRFNSWTDTMVETANCGTDQFAIALTNVAPSASNTVLADITQISYTGFGSRNLVTSSSSQTAGNYSLVFASLNLGTTVTSATFRYVVIYDDTLSGDPLVGWYDIGATTIPANTSLIFSGMGLDLKGSFSPLSLFTGGFQGGWYDPSDLSSMFQDTAGTVPITADGQAVARINDKSGKGNHLTQATAGKRPLYKTSSGLHWIEFDGVDDSLSTASIDFTATDKMSVFAGVTKIDDTTRIISELGSNAFVDNGGWYFVSGTDVGVTGYTSLSKGAGGGNSGQAAKLGTYSGVHSAVVTATHDISGDLSKIRVNATSGVDGTFDKGTGNFGNYPLYIGARAGTSLYFNGKINQLVVVGKQASAGEITSTEQFIASKSGITLP